MSQSPQAEDELFAAGLREAIAARGLSLERLRAHLAQRGHHVSVATLSYWQTARSRPDRAASLAALSSLEEILHVERGSLSGRLPPRRRRTTVPFLPNPDPDRMGPGYVATLAAVAEQLGLSWDDGLTRISVHDIVDIGEGGYALTMLARELLVAQRSTVTRFPIWAQRDPMDAEYEVKGRRNCTVGAVVPVEGAPVAVVELVLSRPLPPGHAMTVEYAAVLSGGTAPMTAHLRFCRTQVRELHMEIRFAVNTLPRAAEQFVVVREKRRTSPLPITRPILDVRHSDFGPGVAGIEWAW